MRVAMWSGLYFGSPTDMSLSRRARTVNDDLRQSISPAPVAIMFFDLIAAGLTPPLGCDPHLMTFGADTYWRGETHRVCDRPGAVTRLLEELAVAGVSQAIVVSAVAAPPSPHRLNAPRLEFRHRLGEFLAAR